LAPSDNAFAQQLIRRFRLTGSAAESVNQLFARPPGATGTITVLGLVVLFFSTLSFTRALQRTWEAAWELPTAGVRGTVHAVSGVGLLLAQILVLTLLTNAVRGWPGGGVIAVVLHVVIAAVLWLQLQYLLLARRVRQMDLVPGGLVAGLAQVAASIYSSVWMPRVIGVDAERYGLIGVTFALLTWLVVIGLGVVVVAVISAEAGLRGRAEGGWRRGRAHRPATDAATPSG
jgi:membrane protein